MQKGPKFVNAKTGKAATSPNSPEYIKLFKILKEKWNVAHLDKTETKTKTNSFYSATDANGKKLIITLKPVTSQTLEKVKAEQMAHIQFVTFLAEQGL